jgi:hypothetical protein
MLLTYFFFQISGLDNDLGQEDTAQSSSSSTGLPTRLRRVQAMQLGLPTLFQNLSWLG